MAVGTILVRTVRKVTSAEVTLDQRLDIKENKSPRGLVLQMVTELLKQTVCIQSRAHQLLTLANMWRNHEDIGDGTMGTGVLHVNRTESECLHEQGETLM